MFLPTRLFKLNTAAVHTAYKACQNGDDYDLATIGTVINTKKNRPNNPKSVHYCAITFTWGLKLESLNVGNISWKVCITSAKKLLFILDTCKRRGYEFVWMDVLCIDQDSNGDKQVEIPKMKDCYRNAHATIVIGDQWENFPKLWNRVEARIIDWNSDWGKPISDSWDGFQDIHDLMQDEWFWRVWTLQETVIPLITRPFDANPVPYTPARLLTAEGAMVDIHGLCNLIEWTYVGLVKEPGLLQDQPYSDHPNEPDSRQCWKMMKMVDAIRYKAAPLHPIQALMLTQYRNTKYGIDKLRGLYGFIDPDWQSLKDDIGAASKEIMEEYIEREEGALLLTMALAGSEKLTWAAAAFKDQWLHFGSLVPVGGRYRLNSPTIVDTTTLKLTVAGFTKIKVPDKTYDGGCFGPDVGDLIADLVDMDNNSFDISSIVELFQLVIPRARLTSGPKPDNIQAIQAAYDAQPNAISTAFRVTFSYQSRRIVTINKISFLAWQPIFNEGEEYSLLWLGKDDDWAVVVQGDVQTGCRKVGVAFVGSIPLMGAQTEVKIL